MGLFRKEEEVLPLGIISVILGFVATAASMPNFFKQINFIETGGFSDGAVALLGAVLFMAGISVIISGTMVLLKYKGGTMFLAIDLMILLGVLLVGLYLALGDPLAFVILAVIVLICFCFYLMRRMFKPKFLK